MYFKYNRIYFSDRIYSSEERVHRLRIVCQESQLYCQLLRPIVQFSALLLLRMVRYMIYLPHCFFSWTVNKNVIVDTEMNASSFFQCHFARSKDDRKGEILRAKYILLYSLFRFISSLLSFLIARDRNLALCLRFKRVFFISYLFWETATRKS